MENINIVLEETYIISLDIIDSYLGIKIGNIIRDDTNYNTPCRLIYGDGEYLIGLGNWFYSDFSEEERKILIEHEYGHFLFKGTQVFSSEVDADFYAVLHNGIKKVTNILKKLLLIQPNNVGLVTRIDFLKSLEDEYFYNMFCEELSRKCDLDINLISCRNN